MGIEGEKRFLMKIVRYPQAHSKVTGSCITIGNFDGVHLGHQALINRVVEEAGIRNCYSAVVTMKPLPVQYFSGKHAVDIITPFKTKAQLIAEFKVDVLCVLKFNRAMAQMSAKSFFDDILVHGLGAEYILVGDDFRFGRNREGDYAQLKLWSEAMGIKTESLNSIQSNRTRISSTLIRNLLSKGDFSAAASMLGRVFSLTGRVAHGRKMGRKLGYPTLNIELGSCGFPLHGVYVSQVRIAENTFHSVTSVGMNPTVGGNAKRVEVHVLDFNQDVYGQTVEVLFYKKLRNEVEFDSLDELVKVIETDIAAGRKFFASFKGELV